MKKTLVWLRAGCRERKEMVLKDFVGEHMLDGVDLRVAGLL